MRPEEAPEAPPSQQPRLGAGALVSGVLGAAGKGPIADEGGVDVNFRVFAKLSGERKDLLSAIRIR
jgi:hypothetical protein